MIKLFIPIVALLLAMGGFVAVFYFARYWVRAGRKVAKHIDESVYADDYDRLEQERIDALLAPDRDLERWDALFQQDRPKQKERP